MGCLLGKCAETENRRKRDGRDTGDGFQPDQGAEPPAPAEAGRGKGWSMGAGERVQQGAQGWLAQKAFFTPGSQLPPPPRGRAASSPHLPRALQAPLVLHWPYWLEPLFYLRASPQPPAPAWGSLAQHPPPPPRGGQTCQVWMGFVFLAALARPALCLGLLHSPANPDGRTICNQNQPHRLSAGLEINPPPAPAKQIHVCLAKSFCFSC